MTQVFKVKPLEERTFFQKLFGKHPPENALIELNNLLASKPILEISFEELSQSLAKYKKLNRVEEFRSEIMQLYKRYLEHCLQDKAFSEKDIEELQHLKKLLNLSDREIEILHENVVSEIYRESLKQALTDNRLDEQEHAFLEKLQQDLLLPKRIAERIYAELSHDILANFISRVIQDGRLSPDEDAEFEMLCKNLGVAPKFDAHTKAQLDRLRLYWYIENADLSQLPNLFVNIKLQKNERCYLKSHAEWYELRTVTKRINYAGLSGRMRIAKGIYYRVGTIAPQRITSEELTYIDSGNLYLTDKRVIFMGSKRNFTIRMAQILAFTPYSDGIEIEKDAGRNPILKINNDNDICCLMFSRLLREA
ncbi:MAG: hypothetical protein CMR00_06115 [[Chlorobium] sp. 445]|nr:MAG: hypothetical protein CMR00_06115 [[Chlorobium] sp. 445]